MVRAGKLGDAIFIEISSISGKNALAGEFYTLKIMA
jgi:hypothetical protein